MLATAMILVPIMMAHKTVIVTLVDTVNQMNSMLFAEMLMNVLALPQMMLLLKPAVIPISTVKILYEHTNVTVLQVDSTLVVPILL